MWPEGFREPGRPRVTGAHGGGDVSQTTADGALR